MKRVVVFGLGAIGGYIGAKLGVTSAFGTELIFIARGAHLKAVQNKGLRYRNNYKAFTGHRQPCRSRKSRYDLSLRKGV
jgi:2-dehydropantoate 2-reductase